MIQGFLKPWQHPLISTENIETASTTQESEHDLKISYEI